MNRDRLDELDELIAWSREQLDADEWAARRAAAHEPTWTYDRETFTVFAGRWSIAARKADGSPINDVDGEHIAQQGPAQTLATVAAHREVLDVLSTWISEERAIRDDYSAWTLGERHGTAAPGRTVPADNGRGLEYAARALAGRFSARPGYGAWAQ